MFGSKTLYNLEIIASPEEKIPKNIVTASLEQLEQEGLLGKKRVNEKGLILNGFDSGCDVNYVGRFDLDYKGSTGYSLREHLELANLTTSGDDELGQKALEIGWGVVEVLEEHDPLSSLDFGDYMSMSYIVSREVNLACGLQSTHVHLEEEEEMIRFWREQATSKWYDYDILVGRLKGLAFGEQDSVLGRILGGLNIFRPRSYYPTLMNFRSNPDSIKKVTW